MSDLEKYIHENRDKLDQLEQVPEEAMWQRIRAKTPPPRRPPFPWKWLSLLAFALVAVGWGLLFFGEKKGQEPQPPVPLQQRQVPPANVPIAEQKMEAPPTEEVPIAQPENRIAQQKTTIRAAAKPKRTPPAKQPPEPAVSDEERELQQLVAQKQREIGLDSLDKASYADLLQELDELEISIAEARKDLSGMPQKERLMETLIRYYELKIRILEQINYEINKKKYHEELEKRI